MRRDALVRIGLALLVGFVAFLVLFPYSGIDTDPPEWFSVFGNNVPTESSLLSALVGLGTALVVGAALLTVGRRRS